MAILGHPLYAGGLSTVGDSAEFAALHALLREHDVSIVMAGDTHDLEYYAERTAGSSQTAHHFVNGGGGAYLSFGTALDWPARPATADWAFYPTRDQVVAKIEATTPAWKRPAWWWTKRIGRLALLRRVALGRLRRQRGAVLPELHRGPRRALAATHSPSALRRPRPTDLERPGDLPRIASGRYASGGAVGVGGGDAGSVIRAGLGD